MHHGQRRRARREGEQQRPLVRVRRGPPSPNHVAGAVMDQRIHRDHVIEPAERRVEHVADRNSTLPAPRSRGARCTRKTDQRRRQVDRDHARAAPRRLDRERAGAAAGIEQPRGRAGRRAATSSVLAHLVAAGADRGPDAADRRIGGQPRPGIDRGAVEVGQRARRAVPGRCGRASVEPQEIEDFAVLQRRGRQRLACRPTAWRRAAYIRPARLRARATAPSRTASISSAGCGGSRRDPGSARAS